MMIEVYFNQWERGCQAEVEQTLLEIALEEDLPLAHDCGGDAVCSTCALQVLAGMEHLSSVEAIEQEALDKFFPNYPSSTRLACQARVITKSGNVVVGGVESPEN